MGFGNTVTPYGTNNSNTSKKAQVSSHDDTQLRAEIGRNIKHWRELRRISQPELALTVKGNDRRATISNWENGHTMPDATDLRKIAERLDVSVDVLLGVDRAQDSPGAAYRAGVLAGLSEGEAAVREAREKHSARGTTEPANRPSHANPDKYRTEEPSGQKKKPGKKKRA